MDQICQKGYFESKIDKMNITIEFCIFELVLVPNFSWNWQFWFLGPNLPKKGISSLKQKDSTFKCVHGLYLLYETFLYWGWQTQRIVQTPLNDHRKHDFSFLAPALYYKVIQFSPYISLQFQIPHTLTPHYIFNSSRKI